MSGNEKTRMDGWREGGRLGECSPYQYNPHNYHLFLIFSVVAGVDSKNT